jgi:hypothetical protein
MRKERIVKRVSIRVSDPYSFFTDPDPEDPDGGQYGSGYGSGSNPDPIRIQGFNDQKLKKKTAKKKQLKKKLNFFLIKNCNLPILRPP